MFDISKDKIALELGLEYSDLTFEDDGSDCFIKNSSGSYLLKLEGVSSSSLAESHFNTTTYLENSLGYLENIAPVIMSGSVFNVSTEATAVGYLSASDTDNDFLHYNIVEVSDYDRASIDKASGLITLNSPLGVGETINLLIEVSDGISRTSKSVSIKGTSDINNTSVFGREIENNDTISAANSVVLEQTIKGFKRFKSG